MKRTLKRLPAILIVLALLSLTSTLLACVIADIDEPSSSTAAASQQKQSGLTAEEVAGEYVGKLYDGQRGTVAIFTARDGKLYFGNKECTLQDNSSTPDRLVATLREESGGIYVEYTFGFEKSGGSIYLTYRSVTNSEVGGGTLRGTKAGY